MKVITTAIASVLMLSRRLSSAQWVSIAVLAAGMVIMQLGGSDSAATPSTLLRRLRFENVEASAPPPPPFHGQHAGRRNTLGGAGAMLLSTMLSAYAGVFLERLFKTVKLSLWMQARPLASQEARARGLGRRLRGAVTAEGERLEACGEGERLWSEARGEGERVEAQGEVGRREGEARRAGEGLRAWGEG
eukprot:7383415-Prymnesium_polylepis.2